MYHGVINRDIKGIFSYGFYSYGFTYFLLNLTASFTALGLSEESYSIIIPRIVTSITFTLSLLVIYLILNMLKVKGREMFLALLIILLMPGTWYNSSWFHPDFMMTLFILISILFLAKSGLKIDRNYWKSVVCWATAVAIKIQAITFAPVYIFLIFLRLGKQNGYSSEIILSVKTFFVVI